MTAEQDTERSSAPTVADPGRARAVLLGLGRVGIGLLLPVAIYYVGG